MDRAKILIVDDEAEIRGVLCEYFAKHMECDCAQGASGKQALEEIAREKYDLIILDIKMPGISGIDVLKKAGLDLAQTDILILSAWDSRQVAQESLKDGAVDYITKTATIDVIFEKVCSLLKKRNKFFPKK